MRIAVVTQYFPTSAQPWAGHSAFQTVRLLAARHPLRVFYPESRYPKLLTPKSRKSRVQAELDTAWQPSGVETRYIPYPALPVVSRPLNGWMMSRRLLAEVQAYRPDVILSYVVYPDGYAAVRLGKKLGVPVVLTAIGSDLNRIGDRLSARHTRQALREAAWTTTVSRDLLQTARRMGADPARSVAILNGCDTAVFYPRDRQQARRALELEPDAEIVVYVGRLDLRKGLGELVTAVASLRDRRPERRQKLRCYLVGDGPDKPRMITLIDNLAAQDAIRCVSACPTQRVALWMAAADLVTLPSYKEGCPNVVIEALASGRPVVATHVGGIPELMDDSSGRLVPAHNAESLSNALDEVLSATWDPAQLAQRHGRSWSDVADELETVLRRASLDHESPDLESKDRESNDRRSP
jgi:teichuronic acid biosynthesis glycosyltransferase TuaC